MCECGAARNGITLRYGGHRPPPEAGGQFLTLYSEKLIYDVAGLPAVRGRGGRPEFGSLEAYRWSWAVPAQDYLSLPSTHSAYRMLEEQARTTAFDAMAERLDARVNLDMYPLTYLARRIP